MSEDPGAVLKRACDAALGNEDFKRRGGKTFCNLAVHAIAGAMGCKELDGMIADQMCEHLARTPERWKLVDGRQAAINALDGQLVIAAMDSKRLEAAHGHVAVIYPIGCQHSPSLAKDVPMVANVGKQNALMRASQAFPPSLGEPAYFTWLSGVESV